MNMLIAVIIIAFASFVIGLFIGTVTGETRILKEWNEHRDRVDKL